MEDIVAVALNSIFENEEETFEELCGSLTVFPPHHQSQDQQMQSILINGHQSGVENGDYDTVMWTNHLGEMNGKAEADCETDDLSAEEIDVGICIESQLAFGLLGDTVVPKVGNFMEDEDSGSEASDVSSLSSLEVAEKYSYVQEKLERMILEDQQTTSETKENCCQDADSIEEPLLFNSICDGNKQSINFGENSFEVMMLKEISKQDPMPGEVFDESTCSGSDTKQQITNIGIKTRIKEITEQTESEFVADSIHNSVQDGITSSSNSDQVQEFKLDENFDYDNVELTPRFQFHGSHISI